MSELVERGPRTPAPRSAPYGLAKPPEFNPPSEEDRASAAEFLDRYFRVLRRHKWLVAAATLTVLMIAALQGDRVSVAAPFYGAPLGDGAPDWSGLTATVEGHFAAEDDFFPPEAITALEGELRGMGKNVTFHVYEGTGHGFTNEENPLGTYDEAATETSMGRALALLGTIS